MARTRIVWTDFLDWFQIPDGHKPEGEQKFVLDFRKSDSENLAGELYKAVENFAIRARQLEDHVDTIRQPEIAENPCVEVLLNWLSQGPCAVYCEISPKGYVAISVGQGPQDFGTDDPDYPINRARVIALVVFSLVVKAFEADNTRDLALKPKSKFDAVKLRVPIDCVWPLQVQFPGRSPYRKRPQKILESLTENTLRSDDKVKRHHVGWMPFPKHGMSVQELLGRRFDVMADRIQHRMTHEIRLNEKYGTQTNESVFARVKFWAFYSTVAVVLSWFAFVFFSAVQKGIGTTITESELWIASLCFALIALWRFVTMMSLSLLLDRSGKLWRPLTWLVNISFWHPVGFYFAPLVMVSLLGWSMLSDVDRDIDAFQEKVVSTISKYLSGSETDQIVQTDEPMKESGSVEESQMTAGGIQAGSAGNKRQSKDNRSSPPAEPPKGYSYGAPLFNWVWTLPILAIGLLVNSYISLRKLVANKNLAERKLVLLGRAENNLQLARTYLELQPDNAEFPKDWPLLTRVQARVRQAVATERSRSDREKAQFTNQSTFNAAAVAILALLKPLGSLTPEAIDKEFFFTENRLASFQAIGPDNCAFPEAVKKIEADETEIIAAHHNARMVACLRQQAHILSTTVAELGLPDDRPPTYPAWFECPWPDAGKCTWARPQTTWEVLPLVQQELAAVHSELAEIVGDLRTLHGLSKVTVTAKAEGLKTELEEARKLMQKMIRPLRVRLELTSDTYALQRDISALKAWLERIPRELTFTPWVRRPEVSLPMPMLSAVHNLSLTLNLNRGKDGGSEIEVSPIDQVFENCRPLGQFLFETNSWELDETDDSVGWRFGEPNQTNLLNGKMEFDELLEMEWQYDNKKSVNAGRLYVLGVADSRGTPELNSTLAEKRAETVAKFLEGLLKEKNSLTLADMASNPVDIFGIVPLSTGELGWIAGLGLPANADDGWHRTAKVWLCPVEDGSSGKPTTEVTNLDDDLFYERLIAIQNERGMP